MMEELSQERQHIELGILGAMIVSAEACGVVLSILENADFGHDVHRTLFSAISAVFQRGDPVDRVTVGEECGGNSMHAAAIDAAIAEGIPPASAEAYAQILRNRARQDAIKSLASEIAFVPKDFLIDEETLTGTVEKINALMVSRKNAEAIGMKEAMSRFLLNHDSRTPPPEYLDFGFPQLKRRLYASRGDFLIIGGEPSAGKTALAAQMACSLAQKNRVGFFSLETTADKLTDRIVSRVGRVPLRKIKENDINDTDWLGISHAAEVLQRLQLEIIPAAGMTVSDIRNYSLAHRYDVVIIDYVQIIRPAGMKAPRYEQVTQISMDLHTFSQQTKTCVIALAQLSRPEKSKDKDPPPPSMHDLKESGQLEQDADAIMLLYCKKRSDYKSNRMLKIGKNKEGERPTIELEFDGAIQSFTEVPIVLPEAKISQKEWRDYQENKKKYKNGVMEGFEELSSDDPLPF